MCNQCVPTSPASADRSEGGAGGRGGGRGRRFGDGGSPEENSPPRFSLGDSPEEILLKNEIKGRADP